MRSHQREADKRIATRTSGRHYGIDKNAFVKEHASDEKGLLHVAHIDGDDRRGRSPYLKAERAKALEGIACHLPQAFYMLGLLLHDMYVLDRELHS